MARKGFITFSPFSLENKSDHMKYDYIILGYRRKRLNLICVPCSEL